MGIVMKLSAVRSSAGTLSAHAHTYIARWTAAGLRSVVHNGSALACSARTRGNQASQGVSQQTCRRHVSQAQALMEYMPFHFTLPSDLPKP